jgi:hypothetical protein
MRAPLTATLPRTDAVTTPVDFYVLGPRRDSDEPALWAVLVRLLQWATATQGTEDPWWSRALRQFYIDRNPPAGQTVLLPGMMIGRCRVLTARITINGLSFDYEAPFDSPIDVDLLLQAEDSDWGQGFQLQEAVCLAGEIPFDRFVVHPDAPPDQGDWKARFPFLQQLGNVALSSSGLVFDANATVPWRNTTDPTISLARYIVEVMLPRGTDAAPPLLVLPDVERIDDGPYRQARTDYIKAFTELAGMLQPEPVNPASTRRRPRWVSLELTNPVSLPGFSWTMRSDDQGQNAVNSFRFDSGVWRLSLTDQPLRVPGVSPRGVLTTNPVLDIPNRSDQSPVIVNVVPTRRPSAPISDATLTYQLSKRDPGYHEQIDIKNTPTVYDPIEAAQFLRGIASLPEPQLDSPEPSTNTELVGGVTPPSTTTNGKVVPPVLFGAVPLDDGWAQLPFLNTTDQILTDTPHQPATTTTSETLFAGAASFGNDRVELFDPSAGDLAWDVTVLDANDFTGSWTIIKPALDSITLTLKEPQLTLNGFFWLANSPPTAEDALPSLDDWVNPIASLSLRTPDPLDLYPPPFVVQFDLISFEETAVSPVSSLFSSANLLGSQFAYVANDTHINVEDPDGTTRTRTVYEQFLNHSVYDLNEFWKNLPLVWQRHATAPAIQSLPLTQSKTPPNYPSASRQLFPFVLNVDGQTTIEHLEAPGKWTFETLPGRLWPRLTSPSNSAIDAKLDGLALVSLGLPGLVFDPQVQSPLFPDNDPADQLLLPQYRHEVALLDEVNALATLPKEDQPRAPGDAPPQPQPGLGRADYADFWSHLAELAFSATADARDALALDAGQTVVKGLIEPLGWQVTASLASSPYPGTLKLSDPNGHVLTLSGTMSDALRGFEGFFRRTATPGRVELVDSGSGEFSVVGEAMAAVLTSQQRIRDQRGLYREATQVVSTASARWLKTRVVLADDLAPDNQPLLLWTVLSPLSLGLTTAVSWDFWIRDLPAVENGATSTFDRTTSHSLQRRGVNNPAANSRRLNHQSGYEWRLSHAGKSPLPLGPLWFYPLSLESAQFAADGGLTQVSILGRLHLPFDGSSVDQQVEPVDRANAVVLSFVDGKLHDISIANLDPDDSTAPSPAASSINEWPLVDTSDANRAAGAPVFRWTHVEHDLDWSSLTLDGQLVYARHGATWTLPAKQVPIPLAGPIPPVEYSATDLQQPDGASVSVQKIKLVFNFSNAPGAPTGHSITSSWQFKWGAQDQLQLVATYDDLVLSSSPAPTSPPAPSAFFRLRKSDNTNVDFELELDPPAPAPSLPPNLDGGGIQIQWNGLKQVAPVMHVLPGFVLSNKPQEACRGFAAMSLDVQPTGGVPVLDPPRGGFLEALFRCEWGQGLQSPLANLPVNVQPDGLNNAQHRVFESSSGAIDAAYTASLQADGAAPLQWTSRLLLNGLVEVKNLISWPRDFAPAATDNLVTLPASRPASPAPTPPLSHVRHTARVLFNQHEAPGDLFVPGNGDTLILLHIKNGQVWTIRAVVEHQFVIVELDNALPPAVQDTSRDCRFSVAQEVRFCSPSCFRAMLDELAARLTTDLEFPRVDATTAVSALPDIARGYLSRRMMTCLTANSSAIANLVDADTMIVEASAPAIVRIDPVTQLSPSNLAYLPVGTPRGFLSALGDYQSLKDDPRDAPQSWVVLALPFFGRLQRATEFVDNRPANAAAPPDLRTDPVLQIADSRAAGAPAPSKLALTLANWADTDPVTIALAEFDLARHRLFSRLDPSSLRESWFRLHLPVSAPKPVSPPNANAEAPPVDTVLANVPTDEPGAMSRPEVLARLMNPARTALPPDPDNPPPALPDPNQALPTLIQWHPDKLLVLDLAGSRDFGGQVGLSGQVVAEYSFLGAGALLAQAQLLPTDKILVRRPAAVVLPAQIGTTADALIQPVSASVSPYLGFAFAPAQSEGLVWLLALSELVCFDVRKSGLISVASKLWTDGSPPADAVIRAWGREIQSRFAADSPIAVIRHREILGQPPSTNGKPAASTVTVVYRFLAAEAIVAVPTPVHRAPALRAQQAAIRFPEGQMGAPEMPPGALADFEIAPPQSIGVQPLRLDQRPPTPSPQSPSAVVATGGTLTAETTYYYKVTALLPADPAAGDSVESAPSLEVSAKPTSTNLSIKIAWEKLDRATAYKVYRGTSPGQENTLLAAIPAAPSTDFTDTGTAGTVASPPSTASTPVWPWGLSAYRFSILYADGACGISGPSLNIGNGATQGRIWWQSLNHIVQYSVPEEAGARKILPTLFRAQAMPGLLPVLAAAPLPILDAIQSSLSEPDGETTPPAPVSSSDIFTAWQPILPGGYTVLVAGARPGAPFAFRPFLQTQEFSAKYPVVSGSIPVMHRIPRPVLLPPNDAAHPEFALQTWAGAFTPTRTVHDGTTPGLDSSPVDSAYMGFIPNPAEVDFVLTSPDPADSKGAQTGKSISGGAIPVGTKPQDSNAPDSSSWDRKLRFQADFHEKRPRFGVGSVLITNPGSGYTSAPSVTLTSVDGNGSGATATVSTDGDKITRVDVTNPGSGYSSPPTISFGGPGSGAQAVAILGLPIVQAALTEMRPQLGVVRVDMDPGGGGTGYISPPTVTITSVDGNGAGATATAVVANGAVTGVTIVNSGSGYTQPPSVSFGDPGTGASAKAILETRSYNFDQPSIFFGVGDVHVDAGGAGYSTAPIIDLLNVDGYGSGATATATVVNGVVTQIAVNNPGSGYSQAPKVQIGGPGSGAAATAHLDVTSSVRSLELRPSAQQPPTTRMSLVDWLYSRNHGGAAEVKLAVAVENPKPNPNDVTGFRQALTFPLRIVKDQGVRTLPYRPAFFLFEDPEYNRRLSSTTSQQSAVVQVPPLTVTMEAGGTGYTSPPAVSFTSVDGHGSGALGTAKIDNGQVTAVTITDFGSGYTKAPIVGFAGGGGSGATAHTVLAIPLGGTSSSQPVTCRLTFAADRHEYNMTGPIFYLYFFDPPELNTNSQISADVKSLITADIQFRRIGSDGAKQDLSSVSDVTVNSLLDKGFFNLLSIQQEASLISGDTLILSLTLKLQGLIDNPPTVQLSLPIVAKPVTPVPEAGYALLRKNPDDESVECVRFAFSPAATRIELLDPNDLHRQIVRRRATFQWRDTVRAGRKYSYAVQKVTTGGSTHFPNL